MGTASPASWCANRLLPTGCYTQAKTALQDPTLREATMSDELVVHVITRTVTKRVGEDLQCEETRGRDSASS